MKRLVAVLILGVFCGCATSRQAKAPVIPAKRIAVLPAVNQTKNTMGGQLARQLTQRWLTERGYTTVPKEVVDDEAAALGIHDVSALTAEQRQALGTRTGADTLAVVDLLAFTAINRGFSHERRVALSVRLLDSQTGNIVWQNTDQIAKAGRTVNPAKALTDYVIQLGQQTVEQMLESPMYPEMNQLVSRMIERLPEFTL